MPISNVKWTWIRYVLTVVAVISVSLIVHYLPAITQTGHGEWFPFFFVIVLTVFWGGFYPGLLALVLTLVAINTMVLPSDWQSHPGWAFFLNVAFCLFALIIIVFAKSQEKLVKALEENRQDLELAQAVAQMGSWCFTKKFPKDTVQWSSETYRLFGITVGTPVNYETFIALVHPDDRDYVKAAGLASTSGKPYDLEFRILVNGATKWLHEKIVYERDRIGQIVSGFGISQDITERKLADQALRTIHERYELVLDGSQDGIWDWNIQTNQVHYSSRWKLLRGYAIDEDLKDPSYWQDNIHPDDEGRILAEMDKHLSGKTAEFSQEYRIRCKDGSWKWILDRGLAQRNAEGVPIRMAGSETDITARKIAEMELKERENQLQLIMDLMPALISFVDTDFRYIRINKAYEEWFGKTGEDIIGRTIRENIGESVWKVVAPDFKRALAGENVFYEQLVTYETGQPRWTAKNYIPVKDETGAVKGIVIHITDISERKKIEQALIEKENALRFIIDAMPALVSYVDTDYRYVRVNKTYETWLGIPIERIVGSEIKDIISERAWEIVKPYFARALAGENIHYELEIPYKIAQPKWIHANYVPDFDASGRVKGVVVLIIDIGESKQAERQIALLNQTLQHRVEELEAIFDAVPVGLAITHDLKGQTIRGNTMLEKSLGLPLHSEISLKAKQPPSYRVFANEKLLAVNELPMQRALQGEMIINQIIDVKRADGTTLTLLAQAVPLFDTKSYIRGAVGIFMDVTELRKAELAVKESEERLQLAKHAGDLGVFDYDLVNGEAQWDQKIREIFGFSADDSITLTACQEQAHPDDLPLVEAALKKAFDPSNKVNYPLEYRIIRQKDQQVIWVVSYGFTRFKDSKPNRFVGFIQDITERKHTEEQLQSTQQRLALAMESLKGGYWDWDIEGNTVYFSPEWKQQIGHEDYEIPNQFEEWTNRIHPDDKAAILATVDQYLRHKAENYEVEFRLRHKDGSYRWILSRAGLTYDRNDQLCRMAGIHLDITDIKNKQALTQRRDEIEDSFRLNLVIQTIAAIAHELNQPLTAVAFLADGAVALLSKGVQNSDRLRLALEQCSEQAQRAGRVVRQLLSVLERGDVPDEWIDINNTIQSAVELVRSNALFDSCHFVLNLESDLPKVYANDLRIQKVLLTVIDNAMQALPESSRKSGTITLISRRYPKDPAFALVTVSDSGIGVPDGDILKQMFTPFFTTKSNGLGMGLAICRSIIEAHNGKIWAEQNVGPGISMHFILPLESELTYEH